MRIFSAFLLVSFFLFALADVQERDVCILGSGASGMFSLSELYKRGYTVQLFEKNADIGGYCNTYPIPAPPGAPNWIDIGVQDFANTKLLNASGFGQWELDFVAWAQGFLPPGYVIIFDLTNPAAAPNYLVDMSTGQLIPVGTQSPAQLQAFAAAFQALFGIVTRYSWLILLFIRTPFLRDFLYHLASIWPLTI